MMASTVVFIKTIAFLGKGVFPRKNLFQPTNLLILAETEN